LTGLAKQDSCSLFLGPLSAKLPFGVREDGRRIGLQLMADLPELALACCHRPYSTRNHTEKSRLSFSTHVHPIEEIQIVVH
jgi:hypothetical protein